MEKEVLMVRQIATLYLEIPLNNFIHSFVHFMLVQELGSHARSVRIEMVVEIIGTAEKKARQTVQGWVRKRGRIGRWIFSKT